MVKQIVIQSHNGTLLSNRNEQLLTHATTFMDLNVYVKKFNLKEFYAL
jgi:hypothetical protein